jgi:hypothetical protein
MRSELSLAETTEFMPDLDDRVRMTSRGAWTALVAAELVALAVLACCNTISQRYLYGDGASFFLALLKNRSITHYDWARYFAHVVTQFPTVFLLKNLGCRDVNLTGMTYACARVCLCSLLPSRSTRPSFHAIRRSGGPLRPICGCI